MKVHPIHSAAELERYVNFAEEVYRRNPHWVPPDPHHLISLLGGQKEAGPHWQAQPFWVESDGRIRATLTAVVDDLYNPLLPFLCQECRLPHRALHGGISVWRWRPKATWR